ncbi:protein transport protein Sec24-like At4g32640 [Fagus crenata]
MPHSSAPSGFVSNGPPAFTLGVLPGGPWFPSAGGAPQPPVGPPSAMGLGGAAPQAPSMRSLLGSPAVGAPPGAPVQPAPPFSASAQGVSSPPGSYGPPTWPMQAGQVVDFGDIGPVRCPRCKAYINPFMKFIDQGRRFICNFCGQWWFYTWAISLAGFTDETPRDYHCNLGPDGRRRDADERPELCRGTVCDPMLAVYFFLIDVSMNAIQTGATAAACSAISQVISDLPEGPQTMVGIATFDCTIHFYNLKRALQQVTISLQQFFPSKIL